MVKAEKTSAATQNTPLLNPHPSVPRRAGSKTGAAAAAAARGSGPTSRPPWVTDPGFADRFHPDKTSTVVTQHQQPAQLTPKQNRSSIMQAAQQAPEDSNRTPVCGACNKIIRWDGAEQQRPSSEPAESLYWVTGLQGYTLNGSPVYCRAILLK